LLPFPAEAFMKLGGSLTAGRKAQQERG